MIDVLDTETGEPIRDMTRSHEAWMHLIATRDDLGTFAHVHPQPTGRPGQLAVDITFPTAGRYIVNTEFRRQGEMGDVHQRQVITVAGAAPAPVGAHREPAHHGGGRRPGRAGRRRGGGPPQRPALHASPTPPPVGRSTTCSPTSPRPGTS